MKLKTLNLLQIYRGVAALLVVCFHATLVIQNRYAYKAFRGFFSFGSSGVLLFFVLSGFIILYAHISDINKFNTVWRYILKRFIRIYPIYWFVLLFYLYNYFLSDKTFNVYHFIANISLMNISNHDPIIGVAWTLFYEVLFYLFFLLLIVNRIIGIVGLAGWLVLILFTLLTGDFVKPPYTLSVITGIEYGAFTNFFRLACSKLNILFFLGGTAFFIHQKMSKTSIKEYFALGAFLIGILLFIIIPFYSHKLDKGFSDFAFSVASFFLVVAAMSTVANGWAKKQSFLLLLGNASYSIYLVHYGLQQLLYDWFFQYISINLDLLFILLVMISVIIGICVYRFIEAPTLNHLRRAIL